MYNSTLLKFNKKLLQHLLKHAFDMIPVIVQPCRRVYIVLTNMLARRAFLAFVLIDEQRTPLLNMCFLDSYGFIIP